MSERPGSFVNASGILADDAPAEVVRKLDAAWEADMVEAAARRMFEQQADKLAAPWERQWEPTKAHWRTRAIEASTPAAPGIDHAEMVKSNLRSINRMADGLPAEYAMTASNIGHEVDHAMSLLDASLNGGTKDATYGRATFEAWAKSRSYSVDSYGQQYVETVTQKLWSAWQAAMQARNDA